MSSATEIPNSTQPRTKMKATVKAAWILGLLGLIGVIFTNWDKITGKYTICNKAKQSLESEKAKLTKIAELLNSNLDKTKLYQLRADSMLTESRIFNLNKTIKENKCDE